MDAIAEVRSALLKCIEGEAVVERLPATAQRVSGWFDPPEVFHDREVLKARIVLCATSEPLATILLARGIGHLRSYQSGLRSAALVSALKKPYAETNEQDRQVIMMEETIAWSFARAELEESGFDDWAAFEAARSEELALQQSRLGRHDGHAQISSAGTP